MNDWLLGCHVKVPGTYVPEESPASTFKVEETEERLDDVNRFLPSVTIQPPHYRELYSRRQNYSALLFCR